MKKNLELTWHIINAILITIMAYNLTADYVRGGELGWNLGYVESKVDEHDHAIDEHDEEIALLKNRIAELEAKLEKSKPEPKPIRVVKSKPVVKSRTVSHSHSGPGHTHRCSSCGARWSHENWNVGNPSAHTCPNCGRLEWGNRTEGWSAPARSTRVIQPTYRPTVRIISSGSYSNCPGGVCPSY